MGWLGSYLVSSLFKLENGLLPTPGRAPPGDERPTEWTTTPDDERNLIVYKRAKPPKAP